MLYCCFSLLLGVGYCWIIRYYYYNWHQLPEWHLPQAISPKTTISVLLPVRNEAQNIESCLQAILQQDYPFFDIWVIDDHSSDKTVAIVERLAKQSDKINLLHLSDFISSESNAHKKEAIAAAIGRSKSQLIVTTDGDCIAPSSWLTSIATYYDLHQPVCITAPVIFHQERNLLERFQSLDFLGMMLITGAGIHSGLMHMGNGANLCYTRAAFNAVEGFKGINQLASGDDLFLIQKLKKQFPGQIHFLKSNAATVKTLPQPSLKQFIRQRLRWGTKSRSYEEINITLILAVVFFFCSNLLLSLLLVPVFGWWAIGAFVLQLLLKITADYFFLYSACQFFNRQELMQDFIPAQLLHTAYIIGIGTASNFFKSYTWKGRKVR